MGRIKNYYHDQICDLGERTNEEFESEMVSYIENERASAVVAMADRIDNLELFIKEVEHRVPVDTAITLESEFNQIRQEIVKCHALIQVLG